MSAQRPASFDLATVFLMREALAHAWACLSPEQRATAAKSILGQRILQAAAAGERDRNRLIDAALRQSVVACTNDESGFQHDNS
jgi:hypothetical protein